MLLFSSLTFLYLSASLCMSFYLSLIWVSLTHFLSTALFISISLIHVSLSNSLSEYTYQKISNTNSLRFFSDYFVITLSLFDLFCLLIICHTICCLRLFHLSYLVTTFLLPYMYISYHIYLLILYLIMSNNIYLASYVIWYGYNYNCQHKKKLWKR